MRLRQREARSCTSASSSSVWGWPSPSPAYEDNTACIVWGKIAAELFDEFARTAGFTMGVEELGGAMGSG